MSTLAHNLSNSAALEQDRKAAFAYARELGRSSGEGKNSLENLGIFFCEQVQKGVLSVADTKALYEDYITAESKKLVHSDGGKAANTSKLANFGKLGALKLDGVAVLQDAVRHHQDMRAAKIKVKGAYLAYETVAKAQIASPNARLSPAEIRDLMSKDDAEKTAKDHLRAAAKALEKAVALPQDMSADELADAQAALANATRALNMLENREARAAKMAELAALQAELGLAA
jgi:hypothetical protein